MITADLSKLLEEANEYQGKIDLPIDERTLEKDLIESIAINSRTGKMLADAKFLQDEAVKNSIVKELASLINLPTLTLNKFVSAYCKNENYAVNWIERINKASDKKGKAIITLISKMKAEMQNIRYGT
jgi:hypothetical protein